MLGIQDAATGEIGPGWATHLDDGRYIDEPNAGVVLMPMALIILLRPDAAGSWLDTCHRLCRHYADRVENEGANVFFRSRIDGRVEPLNHVHPIVSAFPIIGRLTGDDRLYQLALAFMRTFRSACRANEEDGTWLHH